MRVEERSLAQLGYLIKYKPWKNNLSLDQKGARSRLLASELDLSLVDLGADR